MTPKHKKLKQALLLLSCSVLALPVLADWNGQHNDKTCYAKTAGGIEISSACSARGTTCNDDYSCSIGGVEGEMRDGVEKAKEEMADLGGGNSSGQATGKRDAASGLATGKRQHKPMSSTADTSGNKATDYNSSRSNRSEKSGNDITEDDSDDMDVKPDTAVSPRDAASGRATGKRQHKPISSPDTGSPDSKATDYNSSRSNKADGMTAPDGDADTDDVDSDADSDKDEKATDYNSSRSNKNGSK